MSSQHALTLAWLRQNTQPYTHRDIVYTHVDAVLARYPTIRPKTDVYTYDDGRTQLLLCLHGLLPISFRGAAYNIPIAVWVTRDYPQQAPIPYVVPTNDMLVRSGEHMDVSGRCHDPYVRSWEKKSEGCTLAALVEAMQHSFSREPPVYAKPPAKNTDPVPRSQSVHADYSARPPPPLPEGVAPTSTGPHDGRPPLPAKPGASASPAGAGTRTPDVSAATGLSAPALVQRAPPPLPPPVPRAIPPIYSLRPSSTGHEPHASLSLGAPVPPPPTHYIHPPFSSSPPPIPPHPPYAPSPPGAQRTYSLPVSPAGATHLLHQPVPPFVSPQPVAPMHAGPSLPMQSPPHVPAPDLLGEDEPLTASPAPRTSRTPAPAPPRPPNPELLALHGRVHARVSSELASLAQAMALDAERLRAHQADLLAGTPAIRDEMARLEAVRDVCRGVATRVRAVVQEAEGNVAELRRKGDPEVDELVCSTTIVHNQLVNLVAEDNAIEDTIYHLHRALNTGRIDLERFLRTTRVLAEEQFMKRALIEKIHAGVPQGAPDVLWAAQHGWR
ncbi:UEV domain-containing protein [Amylocystis lapponica]|nr:UEV domain-containing protein [Amylocystis lapponica]